MSENFENELDMMELTDEDLEAVAGGKKIVATGSVKVRKGPGLQYGLLGAFVMTEGPRGALPTVACYMVGLAISCVIAFFITMAMVRDDTLQEMSC